MSEYLLHCAIIRHIRGQRFHKNKIVEGSGPLFPCFVTHIYQGRSAEDGFFLKQMGVASGVADILVLWEGGMGFLEVKTASGKLSTPQWKFKDMCQRMGHRYAVVRSVQEAHDQLKAWGLKPRHDHVEEPDLRSKEQKYEDAIDARNGPKKYLTLSDLNAKRINPKWVEFYGEG